ncbi:hypothetical protein [Aurantibacter sp.]|uniref:hypothetical protein n=1 Tax=Aurantibacter sp. TaxID=2807103 RepID=UPI0035C7BFA2
MVQNKVFLITSGAYSNAEITSDFGLLPSSFLPIGHKRLIELQVENIKEFDAVKIVTLPDNYKLLERDEKFLSNNNVIIHRTNPNLNLAQSILSFLNHFEKENNLEELYILHGDTSFESLDQKVDLLYYGFTDMFYKWGHLADVIGDDQIKNDTYKQPVIAGYFSFSKPYLFKQELIKYNSFETALKNYHNKNNFEVVLKSGWLDFGHSNLYYKSKMELNVTRNFNQVIANTNFIKKTSNNSNKMESEYKWFEQLPKAFTIFTPGVWGFKAKNNKSSYKIEFVGAPTLQEKWVFGNLPDFVYYNIINQVFLFIKKSSKITFEQYSKEDVLKQLNQLYITKTEKRVSEFSEKTCFDKDKQVVINNKIYPSLNSFTKSILKILKKGLDHSKSHKFTLMHGDLCFSNILSDTRSSTIKLIDPRGGLDNSFDSKNKIIGDYRYDIAKLGHSLLGNYDYIVTGFYNLERNKEDLNFNFSLQHKSRELLKDFFYNKIEEMEVDKNFIHASIVNLFISMLPLHDEDEDRQIALLLNAYKLFYD